MVREVVAMGSCNPCLIKPYVGRRLCARSAGACLVSHRRLGGGTATRSCDVPRGKHILFSIANVIWIQTPTDDELEPHCKDNETCWRQHANDFLPPSIGGELEATLDGNPIIFNPNTPIIRSQSPVFTASFPPGNVFGIEDLSELTSRPIVSDGFWVMLPPLSPGEHELHFKAGQSQDVTYTLTVR